MFNSFPYTDFHQLNLDWIIKQVKENEESLSELQDVFENQISQAIDSYVAAHLSQFMIAASYNATTRTIKFEEV